MFGVDNFLFDRTSIVLVSPRNPLNIGAAARAMSNFGFPRLRVVNPYQLAFREAKSAVGAAHILSNAGEYTSVADAVADCSLVIGTTAIHNRELHHTVRDLATGARVIRKQVASNAVALLFGSEKRGLSNQDLSHCHWLLHVPTRDRHPSMNLGQAVAVCLYELARTSGPAVRTLKARSAASEEIERITQLLLVTLRASGYQKPRSSAEFQEKVRRLLRRLSLSPEDARTVLGMLRQIVWKIRTDVSEVE